MPAVRASNVAEVIFVNTITGKNWINRMHVAYGGVAPLSVLEAAGLAASMSSTYRSNFYGLLSNECDLVQTEVNDIDPLGFASAIDTTTDTGGFSGSSLPPSVTAMVLWRTQAPRYRGGKPRTFFSGIPAADSSDRRTLAATPLSNWQTACLNFLSNVNALTFGTGPRSVSLIDLAVFRNKVRLATPAQFPVNGATVDLNLRTQRRRIEP